MKGSRRGKREGAGVRMEWNFFVEAHDEHVRLYASDDV